MHTDSSAKAAWDEVEEILRNSALPSGPCAQGCPMLLQPQETYVGAEQASASQSAWHVAEV